MLRLERGARTSRCDAFVHGRRTESISVAPGYGRIWIACVKNRTRRRVPTTSRRRRDWTRWRFRHDRRLRPQRHAADARRSRRRGCLQTGSRRYRAGNSRAVRSGRLSLRCAVLCWLQSWAARCRKPGRRPCSGGSGRGARFVAQGRIGLGRRKSAGRRVCGRAAKRRPPERRGRCRWAAEGWSAKCRGRDRRARSHRSLTVATRRRVSCIHSFVPAQTPTFAIPSLSLGLAWFVPMVAVFGCDRHQKKAPK